MLLKNIEILKKAKTNFEKVIKLQYPLNFSIGSWWKEIQVRNFEKIRNFNLAEEAIEHAQGKYSGFDHRTFDKNVAIPIINFKIKELEFCFPDFSLKDNINLRESNYSIKESLIEINGIPYSSIFPTHLNYYLRSNSLFGQKINKVIEIGGGYGALARIFKIMNDKISYILIDLPESLFYADIFLSLNFPNAKIKYICEDEKINLSQFDFVLIPVQMYKVLENEKFDIAINTGSLQEMPDITVNFWMNFIQNFIHIKLFYSFNYFLNNKKKFSETSHEESNLICPVLDPFWRVRYFKINPEVITVDADGRNWLEVCLERIPPEERNYNLVEYANDLFQKSRLYPRGSNYWFQNIWMAIWCAPNEKFINEIIEGIELFKRGIRASTPRNYYPKYSAKDYISKILNFIFKKKSMYYLLYRNDDFGELEFYGNLLKKNKV